MSTVHIDVAAIMQTSLNGLFTDLVTRATGRTVRTQIEQHIAAGQPGTVSIVDFSNVRLLDFSCADEIIATLMRRCRADWDATERYVLFVGITEGHLDAIEHVLERSRLALIVQYTGRGAVKLVGVVDETERNVWEAVVELQPTFAEQVADATGIGFDAVTESLASLHRQRLLMRDGVAYRAPVGLVA